MPWKEKTSMDLKMELIKRVESGESVTSLSVEYGISRKTVYKFLERYKKEGTTGLAERSRAPQNSPNKIPEEIKEYIRELCLRYPNWAGKKIRQIIIKEGHKWRIPSAATIDLIRKKAGLVTPIKRRYKSVLSRPVINEENQLSVWTIDYKGEFKTGDHIYCYPLTITDYNSRFIIAVETHDSISLDKTTAVLKRCFIEYGVPDVIFSDNGSPFSNHQSLLGLTRLSVWLLQHGIRIGRIEPGKPQQNGRHERMHLTLKRETTRPAAANLLAQQEKFDKFVYEFNYVRPHESLNMLTPSEVFKKPENIYDENLLYEKFYRCCDYTRTVNHKGMLSILGSAKKYQISRVLAGQIVGVTEIDDSIWEIKFLNLSIGVINIKEGKFKENVIKREDGIMFL